MVKRSSLLPLFLLLLLALLANYEMDHQFRFDNTADTKGIDICIQVHGTADCDSIFAIVYPTGERLPICFEDDVYYIDIPPKYSEYFSSNRIVVAKHQRLELK